MKLKFLAALALSAVLLLSGCAAPAKNETTPESSAPKRSFPMTRASSPFTARLPSVGCSPAVSSPVLPKMP